MVSVCVCVGGGGGGGKFRTPYLKALRFTGGTGGGGVVGVATRLKTLPRNLKDWGGGGGVRVDNTFEHLPDPHGLKEEWLGNV